MVYLCTLPPGGFGGRRGGQTLGGFGAFGAQESWNWPSNATVNVRCYTTCPEVVLLLNGRPIGTNQLAKAEQGALAWQLPFEPGVLEARGLRNGQTECVFILKTAGPAQRLELLPEVKELRTDGRDICHVEFRIVDAEDVRVPDAAQEVKFTIEGPAKLLGIENGDLNSPATGRDGVRNAYHGRGLAIVQSTREAGKVQLTARADGLKEASVEIESRP